MLLKSIVGAAALLGVGHACTVIAVGRKASTDGSVMVVHTDDNGGSPSDLRIVQVPAMDHGPGAMRPVYKYSDPYPRLVSTEHGPTYRPKPGQDIFEPDGWIPQVPHTYAYHDADYGLVNEHQLSIAETTTSSRFTGFRKGTEGGHALFAIDELSRLALERCQSARCACQTMGDAAVEYGYYHTAGSITSPALSSASETLAVGDKHGEVWIFSVMAGPKNMSAVWACQRVPDDHVAVVANGLTIREMDLNDKENFLASENVIDAAVNAGFYDADSGKPFDFTAAYGYIEPSPHTTSLYIGRRMWRIYDLVAPSTKMDPYVGYFPQFKTYPFSVKVDEPVSVQKLFDILRDTYEGTEFDLAKGPGAGPYGYPVRFGGNKGVGGWERPVSMFRTLWSFVIQSRPHMPDEIGGLVWFGPDAPVGSVWVPMYASSNKLPASLEEWGRMSTFNDKSLWWAFHFVNDWASRKYNLMRDDIWNASAVLQEAAFANVEQWEERALKICPQGDCDAHDAREVRHMLQQATSDFVDKVLSDWWKFAWHLVGKFQSAYIVNSDSDSGMVNHGYPAEWINTTEWYTWPSPNTYKPPAGADPGWPNELKRRQEEAQERAGCEKGSFPWMYSITSFSLGGLVASVVYYVVVARQKLEYTPLQ